MSYSQLTQVDRFYISFGREQGMSIRGIAKMLERAPSTVSREIRRNVNYKGVYRFQKAIEKTNGRRSRSRKKPQFDKKRFGRVLMLLRKKWSPEQISGTLKKYEIMGISHATIYRYIRRNHKEGGTWYKFLRHSAKQRRKRYGAYDSRGVKPNKRLIDERPKAAHKRSEIGHFEIDTVWGNHPTDQHSILTLVDRMTGFAIIGKLKNRTNKETNACLLRLIKRHSGMFKTITADNGTEFHGFEEIEEKTGVLFYFCRPYHSWERGSNENMNGLIREFLPKRQSMKDLTQAKCDSIATQLNQRPRKRYDYETPEMLYV